jgi:hypothetical protein
LPVAGKANLPTRRKPPYPGASAAVVTAWLVGTKLKPRWKL